MFVVKADLVAGTYEIERDFGVPEQVETTCEVDVDELSGATYQADFYTRETETDNWQLMGGVGSNEVDTRGAFRFTRSRYVKAVVTTTGSDFPSGLVSY